MVNYSSVNESHDRVIILCSGTSVTAYLLKVLSKIQHIPIIAVNGAIDFFPKSNYWITIDPSKINYQRMMRNISTCKYYCGVPDDYGNIDAKASDHRFSILQHVNYLKRLPNDIISFTNNKSQIVSCNSGFAALNLAIHMGCSRVLYLGLDGQGRYSFSGGRPRDLSNMPSLFDNVSDELQSRGIIVKNGSLNSVITTFERVNSFNGLNWIAE